MPSTSRPNTRNRHPDAAINATAASHSSEEAGRFSANIADLNVLSGILDMLVVTQRSPQTWARIGPALSELGALSPGPEADDKVVQLEKLLIALAGEEQYTSWTYRDSDGTLWSRDPDACCALRKVLPLDAALVGFDAWISGRKRFHGGGRAALETIESDGQRIKISPLAHWTQDDIERYLTRHDLPRHPLAAEGFASLGCLTCTRRVAAGETVRAGRWADADKTECGIHRAGHTFNTITGDTP